ncbi:hypothetical protein E2C01_042282 [Portunus trituberculatus]|uniref:Uncharacterized protein n=1 Tax=Portunus trituberculatus TaxID=210409 RepID=A0A5B7FUD0_PORTR|nr:hypothetical protein [Portunus trituberculatus]
MLKSLFLCLTVTCVGLGAAFMEDEGLHGMAPVAEHERFLEAMAKKVDKMMQADYNYSTPTNFTSPETKQESYKKHSQYEDSCKKREAKKTANKCEPCEPSKCCPKCVECEPCCQPPVKCEPCSSQSGVPRGSGINSMGCWERTSELR